MLLFVFSRGGFSFHCHSRKSSSQTPHRHLTNPLPKETPLRALPIPQLLKKTGSRYLRTWRRPQPLMPLVPRVTPYRSTSKSHAAAAPQRQPFLFLNLNRRTRRLSTRESSSRLLRRNGTLCDQQRPCAWSLHKSRLAI